MSKDVYLLYIYNYIDTGVLDSIFHQLCDNGIVKKAVFEAWREKVMEGCSALQSAKNFFDLLHRQ